MSHSSCRPTVVGWGKLRSGNIRVPSAKERIHATGPSSMVPMAAFAGVLRKVLWLYGEVSYNKLENNDGFKLADDELLIYCCVLYNLQKLFVEV